jgi:hypothetical protein
MLNVNKMMGTMIGRRRQMQDIKEGKATCVLKGKYTAVRPGTKHVTFHAGIGVRMATDWPAQENLVARLRMKDGSCVMGPFTDADEILRASKDGYRYKLGTGMTREVLRAMLARKGELYVYMFYPAEVCRDLVWNHSPTLEKVDWDYFVYCMRSEQRTVVWFYSMKETAGALPVARASMVMDYASVLTTGSAEFSAVDFRAVAGPPGVLADMMPVSRWNAMNSRRLREAVGSDGIEEAAVMGPVSRAWAGGVDRSDFQAGSQQAAREAEAVPVYASETTRAMIREAQAACARFQREAAARGMDAGRLHAVATMERALDGIEAAMDIGGMALGGSLGGLLDALSEYGWAMEAAGIPRTEIERVQAVWRAIEALQRSVLGLARGGGAGGGSGVVGPVPLGGEDW